MPIFEYNCEHCNYNFDTLVIRPDAQMKWPLCQGKIKKRISTFSVGASYNFTSNLPPGTRPKKCPNC